MEVKSQVKNFDGNGKINCIDNTLLWKHLWDKHYPDDKDRCDILRRKSNLFHHLCIGVYDDYSNLIIVESQADKDPCYFVRYQWGGAFYDRDIIYGETQLWLNGIRIE